MKKKVKLLIITQKVDENDDVLGFFHGWIKEFSKHCEKVTVICLEEGKHSLPDNVKVLSLGKEQNSESEEGRSLRRSGATGKGATLRKRLIYTLRFYKHIWQERKNYDTVFVHMNPEYVVLGGLFWKAWKKKISLWYTHRNVDLKLKLAEKLVGVIFTASKESFQLESKKVKVTGHGIDISRFKFEKLRVENDPSKLNILHVGRITSIKNIDVLIQSANILKEKYKKNIRVLFIGSPITEDDEEYFLEIKEFVKKLGLEENIVFFGSVPNKDVVKYYYDADISVNLAPTGGVDKAVLESMAAKRLVFASNLAFQSYFGQYYEDLMFKEKDPKDLAEKIVKVLGGNKKEEIENYLQNKVLETSSLEKLIEKIIKNLTAKN